MGWMTLSKRGTAGRIVALMGGKALYWRNKALRKRANASADRGVDITQNIAAGVV